MGAGAETTIETFSGVGYAAILFQGDGDGVFNMEVYVDGTLDVSFATNVQEVYIATFASSLVTKIKNPTGSSATQTSSTYNLRGMTGLT